MAAKSISQWEELHDEAMDLIPLAIERLELSGYVSWLFSLSSRLSLSLSLSLTVLAPLSLPLPSYFMFAFLSFLPSPLP